jgi:hypothetical protein
MQNFDIIILSSIVGTLFLVFFITIYREIVLVSKDNYRPQKEGGPRVQLVTFMGNLFDDNSIANEDKKKIYKAVNRTIADMESDGMYFSEEVKQELKKRREELNCEYSGLPSVKAYEN